MPNNPTFIDPGVAAGSGYSSPNYHGSSQEWLYRASRSLAERYMRGDQSMLNNLSGATGPIGQPDGNDYGSGSGGNTGHISYQTYDFFERYLREYGSSDPYVTQQFGAPPSSSAQWEDPNIAINGRYEDRARNEAEQNALNRASDERIAAGHDAANLAAANVSAAASRYAADQQLAGVRLGVESDWKIAQLNDATRRYIAEGDWGTQKYVAQLQESGALERLKLELGQRDKELAQAAEGERNRHHESMVALTLEVAKYDQQLASQPRNWIAYAAWLQNRGQVINGLNLATAAQVVPETSINPAEVANSPVAQAAGGNIASVQQAETVATGSSQQMGGSTTSATTQPAQGAQGAGTTLASQGTPQQQAQVASGQQQYQVGNVDLTKTDYSAMANQLLGIGANTTPPTQEQLQATYDSVNPAGRNVASFGAWGGPTTNSLGITVNPLGQKNDFRKFSKLLPSQQDMNVAGAESVGKPAEDYAQEMQRARPKGKVAGTSSWG